MKKSTGRLGSAEIRPCEILFGAVFLLWLLVPVNVRDDNWFFTTWMLNFKGDLLSFLQFRYETWSTRLILEGITVLIMYHPIVYRVLMAVWVCAIVTALMRLLGRKGEKPLLWTMVVTIALIPMDINLRAGYVCTTVNYVFALACILWAAVPVVERLRGEDVALWRDILAIVLMVVGCNMEYYCPPALILFAVLAVRQGMKKQIPWLSVLLAVIAGVSLWYALTAPASTVSAYEGDADIFPGFENLTILQKMQAAFVSTAGGLISTYCHGDDFFLGTLTFGIVLALWGWEREKGLWRWLSFVPGGLTLGIGVLGRIIPGGFSQVFFDSQGGWLWTDLWALIMAALFFGTTLACLWRVDRRLFWAYGLVLFCRITMAVSRSLFSSGLRTFYPMFYVYGAAIAITMTGLQKLRKPAWICLGATSGIMLLVNIYQLLT